MDKCNKIMVENITILHWFGFNVQHCIASSGRLKTTIYLSSSLLVSSYLEFSWRQELSWRVAIKEIRLVGVNIITARANVSAGQATGIASTIIKETSFFSLCNNVNLSKEGFNLRIY